MVSVEVALCTVLLIVGGLLMVSFFRMMRVEKGFEVAHVITQDVSFLSPKYAGEVRVTCIAITGGHSVCTPGEFDGLAIREVP